ncbi:PREDICTED: basic proline-rich protein-like [Lepidothrix coronata]|uniref:Basic proline-rich protein-like n=1 Tax=Lepidothrix coronata TaxID=321398 RepID=A0A6J0I9A0_9PASS|nr:PREDICTED: basic proline-rich protein-like [Lepidothrix coronata]
MAAVARPALPPRRDTHCGEGEASPAVREHTQNPAGQRRPPARSGRSGAPHAAGRAYMFPGAGGARTRALRTPALRAGRRAAGRGASCQPAPSATSAPDRQHPGAAPVPQHGPARSQSGGGVPAEGEPDTCHSPPRHRRRPRQARHGRPAALRGERCPPQPPRHTHERARTAAAAPLPAEGDGCRGREEPEPGLELPVRPRPLRPPRAGQAVSDALAHSRGDTAPFLPFSCLFLKQTLLVPQPPRSQTGGARTAPARAQGPPRRRCGTAEPGRAVPPSASPQDGPRPAPPPVRPAPRAGPTPPLRPRPIPVRPRSSVLSPAPPGRPRPSILGPAPPARRGERALSPEGTPGVPQDSLRGDAPAPPCCGSERAELSAGPCPGAPRGSRAARHGCTCVLSQPVQPPPLQRLYTRLGRADTRDAHRGPGTWSRSSV